MYKSQLKADNLGRVGRGRYQSGNVRRRVEPEKRRQVERSSAKMEKFKFLGVELFHWWSLVAEGDKARVGDDQLLAQAHVIIQDAVAFADERRALGDSVPQLRFPKLTWTWLSRWRKKWNLSLQSVNCQYKVAFSKTLQRLGVSWRNATRLLVLHELLYGRGKLTFVSVDEKHFKMNAAAGDKMGAEGGRKATSQGEANGLVGALDRHHGQLLPVPGGPCC